MAENALTRARTSAVNWLDVPRAEALIVLAALGLLIIIAKGFRGVNIDLG